jgi:hypothetical protein
MSLRSVVKVTATHGIPVIDGSGGGIQGGAAN